MSKQPTILARELLAAEGIHLYTVAEIRHPYGRTYHRVATTQSGYYTSADGPWFRLADTGRRAGSGRRICRVVLTDGRSEWDGIEVGRLVEVGVYDGRYPDCVEVRPCLISHDGRIGYLGSEYDTTEPLVAGYATSISNDSMLIVSA